MPEVFEVAVPSSVRALFRSLLVEDCSPVAKNHATESTSVNTYFCVQIVGFVCITGRRNVEQEQPRMYAETRNFSGVPPSSPYAE